MAQGLSPVPPRAQAAYVIPNDRPVYRINSEKFFGPNDRLYIEGDVIAWYEEPCLSMEPLNDLAHVAKMALLEKLDGYGRKAAKATGKAYSGYASAYETSVELAQQEGRRVELINAPDAIPLMGKRSKQKVVEQIDTRQLNGAPLMSDPRTDKKLLSDAIGKKMSITGIKDNE